MKFAVIGNIHSNIFALESVDVIICGHTHKPYYKVINGKHIINSGSAGKPKRLKPAKCFPTSLQIC